MGRIVAGELDEGFASTLYEWNKRDYEAQWLRSLERFINGDTKAALVTQYLDPAGDISTTDTLSTTIRRRGIRDGRFRYGMGYQ